MPAPFVSVIMPAFNAERHVRRAVRSILDQDYAPLELIVWDDGSTDRTLKILRRLERADRRLRVWTDTNRGIVTTLNRLVSLARGELIARMDADDLALPWRVRRQVHFLEGHPECVAVGGQVCEIDEWGHDLGERYQLPLNHDEIDRDNLAGKCALNHPSALVRAEAYRAVGGYRPLAAAEDHDLWLRLAEIGRLANLPDLVTLYRVHARSRFSAREAEALDQAEASAREAAARRGIACTYRRPALVRNVERPRDRAIRLGWVGFKAHDRVMAARYAVAALRVRPGRDALRLLACAISRPCPVSVGYLRRSI